MKALILVNVQRDFMSGGKLPVEQGDRILPALRLARAPTARVGY